jgi:arylsulfatase A-like enzyme
VESNTPKPTVNAMHITFYRTSIALLLPILVTNCTMLPKKMAHDKALEIKHPYNILFITYESMNTKHLQAYGYDKMTSGPTAKLAQDGVKFERCISASCWTSENVNSLFTGMSSLMHGVVTRNKHMPPEWYTPFEMLRDAGYTIPRMQGYQADINYSHLGFTTDVNPVPGPELVAKADRGPKDLLQPLVWLENNKDKPFFLWYHVLNTHLPYDPEPWAKAQFWSDDLIVNEQSRERVEYVRNNGVCVWGSVDFVPEEDAPAIRALYDGELRRAENMLLKLWRKIDALELTDKTLIVFCADHGEELLEHGFIGHASTAKRAQMFDEIIHVPLVFYLPGVIPKGVSVSEQVRTIDIMPTIFDLLGVEIPPYMQGRSLMPMITQTNREERTAIVSSSYAGYKEDDPDNITHYMRGVRTKDWKLIKDIDQGVESFSLYDLANDPGEKSDVAGAFPERVAELRGQLDDFQANANEKLKFFDTTTYTEPIHRTTPWKKFWSHFKFPQKPIPADVSNPPVFLTPGEGEVLTAESTQGRVHITWEGMKGVPYLLEVELGEGDYYFTTYVRGKKPEVIRTFRPSYWDTYIRDYDPARIRVKIDRPEYEWSSWRTVRLK